MQHKPDFKSSFLALMEEESPGDHPAAEELAAYHAGELASRERERIHLHLGECRECAELARDLDLFTSTEQPIEAASEFEVAAFLRALKPQLAPQPPAATSRIRPLAVAASLILAVAASWWLSRGVAQRELLAELSRPRAIRIVDLIQDASQRTGRRASPHEIRRDVGEVLILTPDSTEDFAEYEARILTSEGVLVYPSADLEIDPDGDAFVLLISAGSLEPGDYSVELHGRAGERVDVELLGR